MAMAANRSRQRGGTRASLLFLAALFLLALVVISQLGENGLVSWLKLRREIRTLETETSALERGTAELERKIDAVLNDPLTLEHLARERCNMKAEGEEVLVILPPTAPDDGADGGTAGRR